MYLILSIFIQYYVKYAIMSLMLKVRNVGRATDIVMLLVLNKQLLLVNA